MGAAERPVNAKHDGIVILSRESKTREELKRTFDGLIYEFANLSIATLDMSHLGHIEPKTRLVILDLETWIPSDELALNELRINGYEGPVIVLTRRLSESAGTSYGDEKVVFFDRAHGIDELLGIGKRLIKGQAGSARKFIRHFTNEKAEVRVDGLSSVYLCKVRNISKGGALLIAEQTLSLGIGDNVVLKIHLTQLKRLYHVRARVAWIRLPKFGVEFVAGAL
jgi:hypothetical protein